MAPATKEDRLAAVLAAQPAEAQRVIDYLGVIEEKTKGNLTDEESKVLNGALYDLRMRYVQASA